MIFTPRVGVYICHCGINIAATVDVAAVAEYAGQLPGVVVARDYTYMCSDPGQALIKNDILALVLPACRQEPIFDQEHQTNVRPLGQSIGETCFPKVG